MTKVEVAKKKTTKKLKQNLPLTFIGIIRELKLITFTISALVFIRIELNDDHETVLMV
ncbi:MAG: hypothetical protein PVH12_04250 [Candidatus Bathyarchaeota archaeon]